MIPILMYHQVAEISPKNDPLGLAVTPIQFETQMDYLSRHGFHCLSLRDIVRYILEGWKAPSKSFVLTFDDGYQNVLSNASPILRKFGFSATVFLVANQIGSMSNWWGQSGIYAGRLLSQLEVKELLKQGFQIGSHTLNHRFLNTLDEKSALEEIQNSKKLLEELFRVPIDFISYPFSETDEKTKRLVKFAGYKAACAGDCGHWGIFNLWRVPCIRSDSMLVFRSKINGLYNFRTALRESSLGLSLRLSVRKARKMLGISHPSRADLNYDEAISIIEEGK